MANHPGWGNAKIMANQGHAPKVKEVYLLIVNDPFSSCFFLSSLYAAKEKELLQSHPHFFNSRTHEIARIRVELVLVNMYLHIKTVQKAGLQSLIKET